MNTVRLPSDTTVGEFFDTAHPRELQGVIEIGDAGPLSFTDVETSDSSQSVSFTLEVLKVARRTAPNTQRSRGLARARAGPSVILCAPTGGDSISNVRQT